MSGRGRWPALALFLALLAAPWFLARPQEHAAPADAPRLVILTPHNEYVRLEFERAFADWSRRELGQAVGIDWRTGGTSDLTKQIRGQFAGAAKQRLQVTLDARDPAEAARATAALKASDVGIGADLFFGGGAREYGDLADNGFLVDAGLRALEPDWFRDEVIPARVGSEKVYDAAGCWYGVSLSSFGVCANPDRCAELGAPPPTTWLALGDPRLVGAVSVGDPTKSGSVNTCYEMIIHSRMAAAGGADPDALDAGWRDGLLLIRRMIANARSINDGAARVVREVSRADAAAGMCIATYGRLEAEWSAIESGGRERLVFADPRGGSAISPDPIGLLRGAPRRELATACIRFALSDEWQRVLCYRVGAPGGPARYALRNLPVRRTLYGEDRRALRSDPDADPYRLAEGFAYHPEWTGKHFDLIRKLIKALALDPRPELQEAWRAIIAAGGPEAVPAAMDELAWLPFPWRGCEDAEKTLKGLKASPELVHAQLRRWSEDARVHYRAALRLAEAARR